MKKNAHVPLEKRRTWCRHGKDDTVSDEEILFFSGRTQALSLYEHVRECIMASFPETEIKVSKTQISFKSRYGYAFVSLRRMKGCGENFIILTLGLPYRLDSPRAAAVSEPYPNRWTTHFIISSPDDIDAQMCSWISQAHDYALMK